MFSLKNKKVCLCLFLVLSVATFLAASNDSLEDEIGVLPKGTYKKMEKLIKATAKKLKTDISVVFVKDEEDVAEDHLSEELLVKIANDNKKYEGLLLLVVIDNKDEVGALYMDSMGEATEKVFTDKREHYILDAIYDLAFENEEYEDGIALFLKMVELFFEYGA